MYVGIAAVSIVEGATGRCIRKVHSDPDLLVIEATALAYALDSNRPETRTMLRTIQEHMAKGQDGLRLWRSCEYLNGV